MHLRMLGPLEVESDGRLLDLGAPKQRSLFALLLVHANRVVTTDRILDELWGDDADGKLNALWVYISRLRTVLEPDRTDRGASSLLLTRDHGYVLSVDPARIDAHVFEAGVTAGRAQLATDPREASATLADALALWRGPVLEEFHDAGFVHAEATRLEELRLVAIEQRIEADLQLGRARELVAELDGLCCEQPLRENLVRQLMLAQYRSGRHADALRVYRRFRRHLDDELGLEPSPELRRLEEQVLLHDPRLAARHDQDRDPPHAAVANPFKGLRPFGEDDTADFFGRERLVSDILRRIRDGARFLTVVGPSGSGKSSVARAGVVPAIRKASAGDGSWLIAQMVPGAHPFAELEAALLRSTLDAPDALALSSASDDAGVLRAVIGLLSDDGHRLLLVIDQFEELFTLVDDVGVRSRFLDQLLTAVDDPHGRVAVVATLRADAYSRPLAHPSFGARMGDTIVNVVPLRPDELEVAAQQPAMRVGVHAEPALLVRLLTDVLGQPGSLPLFQYTLTELFHRRSGDLLTLDAYRALGGVDGAVTNRAEDLFATLDDDEQQVTRQLFLRLVTIGDEVWSRRRVLGSEIATLNVDAVALQRVIALFATHRLLTLDRDRRTGSPTVEVAHEALLTTWGRLRTWIDDARDSLRRHATLTTLLDEWRVAERHADYLPTGSRLDEYDRWAADGAMRLTDDERAFLAAARQRRSQAQAADARRRANEAQLATSNRRRLVALGAVLLAVAAAAVVAVAVAFEPAPARVIAVTPSLGPAVEALHQTGYERAVRELDVEVEHLTGRFADLEDQYRELAEVGADLLFIDPGNSGWGWVGDVVADHPDTTFAVVDGFIPPPGAHSVFIADEQAGALAGVVAANVTSTDVVGFIGADQQHWVERWRGGFEAGVRSVDPDLEVLAVYIDTGVFNDRDVSGGRRAAAELFERGADVVVAFAGDATEGVLDAAREHSVNGSRRWVIGTESDWSLAAPAELRPYVLTSVLRRWDVVVFETISRFVSDDLRDEIVTLGLDDGAIDLARSDHLARMDLDRAGMRAHVAGLRPLPFSPTGDLLPPPAREVTATATVTWDGAACTYDGPATFEADATVEVRYVNSSSDPHQYYVFQSEPGALMSTHARPGASSVGHVTLLPQPVGFHCSDVARDEVVTELDEQRAAEIPVVDAER